MLVAWLLTLWLAPADLSDPSWHKREAATERLAAAGPLAWPFLWPLLASDDAEARSRATALLKPSAAILRDARAAQPWLAGDLTAKRIDALQADTAELRRVADAFRRFGLLDYDERAVMVANEIDWWRFCWELGTPEVTDTHSAIVVARRRYAEANPPEPVEAPAPREAGVTK